MEQPRLGMPRGVVQASLCRGVLESSSPGTEVKVMGLVRPELSLIELLSSLCLLQGEHSWLGALPKHCTTAGKLT